MTFYDKRDLASGDEYDLLIESEDLVIEDTPLSMAGIASFRVLTSPAEWVFDQTIVSGIKRMLGSINSESLRKDIAAQISRVIFRDLYVAPKDIAISVLHSETDPNIAILILEFKNIDYFNDRGQLISNAYVKSTYYIDTLTGKLTYFNDVI